VPSSEDISTAAHAVLDAALDAIVSMDEHGVVTGWNPAAEAMFGRTREEALGRVAAELIVPAHFRAAPFDALQRIVEPEVPSDVRRREVLSASRADGTEFPVEVRVTRPGVAPAAFTAFVRDLSAEQAAQRSAAAHQAVNLALAAWQDTVENLTGLCARLAGALGFEAGVAWIRMEGEQSLACRAFWSAPDLDLGPFEEATRKLEPPLGSGLAGFAAHQMRPVTMTEAVEAGKYLRAAAAQQSGLHGAVAFPAPWEGKVVAVLELCSRQPAPLEGTLAETLTVIGDRLGEFLGRRRLALGTPPVTARELEVLQLAAEGRTVSEVAAALTVSPSTVKTHFEHIYGKLGVPDRGAAVAEGFRRGILR